MEKKVLDLFAGSGSLGIEALSRGCSLVYFVDKSIQSVELIRYNTRDLPLENSNFKIIKKDVSGFLRLCEGIKWDIIFLDPPYKIMEGKMREIFEVLAEGRIADHDTLIIYEYFFKRDITDEVRKLKVIKESFFGDKKVGYFNLL